MSEIRSSRSEQTRARILSAAEKIFAEKGLDGARVDEIADAAKTNKRMLYEYYGSKEGLYGEVLRRVYQRLGDCERFFTTDEFTGTSVIGAIRPLVDAYLNFVRSDEIYVRMVMWENLYGARHFDEYGLGTVRDPMKKALSRLLQSGKDAGIFRPDAEEDQVLMTIFACTFNYFSNIHTMTRVMGSDLASDEQIARRAAQITEMLTCYLTAGMTAG